ncbi:MAG: ABC transporter substrate-binding protein [Armatimonadota bacterium]|nr:ABC transporter substrate-binding protein [Armatimonadota bacterium]
MDASVYRRVLAYVAILMATLLVPIGAPRAGAQAPEFIITWFLGFNTTLPPFDNVMMRRAVASAIDRAQVAAADKNNVSVGLEPPQCLAHNANARAHPFDVQRAKEFITQSGVNLDEFGDMGLWYISRLGRRDTGKKELEVISANLTAAGLRIALREFGNYNALQRIATLSVVKMQYWGLLASVDLCSRETFLEDLVHSKGDFNYFGYSNGEMDGLIARARAATDRQTKVRLFQEAEQKILDDAILVPLWWWKSR